MTQEKLTNLKILLIGFFGSIVLRVVNLTLRWERVGLSGSERWWADGKPSILLFWHGRQLFMPWIYRKHRRTRNAPAMTVLISQHNDGRMIAEGMRFLGIDSVAGSSSRGGLRAIHTLINKLKDNSHVAITPDGPKGPPQKLKSGTLLIAQRTGSAIHTSAFAAEKYWKFKSWDGMIFPKPFSRAVMIKGAPFSIINDGNAQQLDSLVKMVEDQLNEVTDRADKYFLLKKNSVSI